MRSIAVWLHSEDSSAPLEGAVLLALAVGLSLVFPVSPAPDFRHANGGLGSR